MASFPFDTILWQLKLLLFTKVLGVYFTITCKCKKYENLFLLLLVRSFHKIQLILQSTPWEQAETERFIIKFYFIFKLYNIVLVLPNREMNPPQVYLCSASWTLLPPPSPYPPSGSSQCTSPKHPVLCIEPGLATCFIHDIIHVSMPFFQTEIFWKPILIRFLFLLDLFSPLTFCFFMEVFLQ